MLQHVLQLVFISTAVHLGVGTEGLLISCVLPAGLSRDFCVWQGVRRSICCYRASSGKKSCWFVKVKVHAVNFYQRTPADTLGVE